MRRAKTATAMPALYVRFMARPVPPFRQSPALPVFVSGLVRFPVFFSGKPLSAAQRLPANTAGERAPPRLQFRFFVQCTVFCGIVSVKRPPFAEAACRGCVRYALCPQTGGNPAQERASSSFPVPFSFFSDGSSAAASGSFPKSVSAGLFSAAGS